MKKVSNKNHDEFFFIAEIGVNHEGSIDLAKKMIKDVAKAGAHAAKFQTYKADLLSAKESPAYWDLKKNPQNHKMNFLKNMIILKRQIMSHLRRNVKSMAYNLCRLLLTLNVCIG